MEYFISQKSGPRYSQFQLMKSVALAWFLGSKSYELGSVFLVSPKDLDLIEGLEDSSRCQKNGP